MSKLLHILPIFFLTTVLLSQPDGWSPTPNPSSGTFIGQATINGIPAGEGDWSAAFDEDGNCAGAAELVINAGTAYINMPIYGDDNTTPDVDEGMNAGENFILKLWDSSEDAIMIYLSEFDCWYNNNGAPMDGCGDVDEVYDFTTGPPPMNYTVTVMANPEEGGTVTGGGEYEENTEVTVTATANDHYNFVNWTENGVEVSPESSYTFVITQGRDLIANFEFYNNPPVADDLSVTTDEDTSADFTLTGSDPEGDELTYEVTSDPSNGSLSGDASELTYMPNADFYGNDSFTFSVSDGDLSDEGTVSITVNVSMILL